MIILIVATLAQSLHVYKYSICNPSSGTVNPLWRAPPEVQNWDGVKLFLTNKASPLSQCTRRP